MTARFHSVLILLFCIILSSAAEVAAQDEVCITVQMSRKHGEITLPNYWIDFDDMYTIADTMMHPLTGLDPDIAVKKFGYFELSVKEHLRQRHRQTGRERYAAALGDYPENLSVDSRIDFAVCSQNGEELVFIDLNNDEYLSAGERFAWKQERKDFYTTGQVEVNCEIFDGENIVEKRVALQLIRIDNHRGPGVPAYKGELFEYVEGAIELDGDVYNIALTSQGEFVSYDAPGYLAYFIDFNENGSYERVEQYYPKDGPIQYNYDENACRYSITGVSPDGLKLFLKKEK